MSTLMKASNQWATRPADERYLSLPAMHEHFLHQRDHSRGAVIPSKKITVMPDATDENALGVVGEKGIPFAPTHWSFGQLAQLAGAPAGYLRELPPALAADNINYGIKHKRDVEDVGLLLFKDGDSRELRAATGPNYGRIWNVDLVKTLIDRFGDGVTGEWKVPGEFRKAVTVTKDNTTLYASDRDMFVFLCDEVNRIELPNRRHGQHGTLARGFFLWNSEVGSKTMGLATFLFDFVCCNRIVWGAEMIAELRIRHTVSAPDKWIDEMRPVLTAYANGSAQPVEDALRAAQAKKIDDVKEFLANRFGRRLAPMLASVHESEEGRPIETLWDAATAVTAYARGIEHIDARVELERKGGELLRLAA
jgi:hypothetical protein